MVARALVASATSPDNGGGRIEDIEKWFERRNLPYTTRMDTWLQRHEITTTEKMKNIPIGLWKEVLLDQNDPGTLVYREGLAFEHFEEDFQAFVKGTSIFDKKVWCRYVLGALLSYFILALFVLSTLYYIIRYYVNDCDNQVMDNIIEDHVQNAVYEYLDTSGFLDQNKTEDLLTDAEETILFLRSQNSDLIALIERAKKDAHCDYIKADQITIGIHNVTFGLVSAVVIGELVTNASGREGLYAKFGPLLEDRKDRNGADKWYNRFFKHLILQTTRIYVIVWIATGSMCLIFGIVTYSDEGSLGVIFTTGQTWLGLAVTQTYAYFGVERTDEQRKSDDRFLNSNPEEGRDDGGNNVNRVDSISTGNGNEDEVKNKSIPQDSSDGTVEEEVSPGSRPRTMVVHPR